MLIPLSISALMLSGVSAYMFVLDHSKQEEKRLSKPKDESKAVLPDETKDKTEEEIKEEIEEEIEEEFKEVFADQFAQEPKEEPDEAPKEEPKEEPDDAPKEAPKEASGDSKSPWLTKPFLILGIVMTLLSIGIAVSLSINYPENSFLYNIKRIILLSLLWPIAFVDYKSYRIPNIFIITGLTYRGIILACELVFEYDGIWTRGLADLIAAGALGLAAVLCGLVLKNSIGFGDVKLFIVMGLFLGLDGIWSAIFASLVVSFFISIVLLVSKKKKRKDSIPFAPAIMLGTYLSVFLTGM